MWIGEGLMMIVEIEVFSDEKDLFHPTVMMMNIESLTRYHFRKPPNIG